MSTGTTTLAGAAKVAVAAGHRSIREDPVAWAAHHEERLAILAPPPLDPDVILGDQVTLASQIQAELPKVLPGLEPAQIATLSVAVMPHILRAIDVQARLEDRRERRAQAQVAQALPAAATVEEPMDDQERLRRMATAIRVEAQMAGMWPGGTVEALVADMERQAGA